MLGITADELIIGDLGLPARIFQSLRLPIDNITVTTALTTANMTYVLQTNGLNVDLPDPATCDGQIIAIKNDVGITGTTVTADGGTKDIDGALTYTLVSALDSILVQASAFLNGYRVIASTTAASVPATVPQWQIVPVNFPTFQTAGLVNSVVTYTLPAAGAISGVKLKSSIAFVGTGITSLVMSVGIGGDLERYIPKFDMMSAVAGDNFSIGEIFDSIDSANTTQLLVTATATGANLSALTAGFLDVGFLASNPGF